MKKQCDNNYGHTTVVKSLGESYSLFDFNGTLSMEQFVL